MRRRLLVVVVALAAAVAMVSPARAAIDQPVATWEMNEPVGSATMLDSSGNGINGAIGAHVQEGTALSGGGTGYRFPYLQPNTPPADPEHVVRVAHDARLNPGSGDFAVEFRMRTTHSFGNILQKGQAGGGGRLLEVPAAQRQGVLPVPGLVGEQHGLLGDGPGQRRGVAHGAV